MTSRAIPIDPLERLVQPASVTQTFAILAVRGAGKTNAARSMAEAMFDLKLPFVAVDPVGSWWGLRASRDGNTPGLPIPVFGGRHGDIPLEASAGAMLADLIIDKRLSCVLDLSQFGSESDKKRFLLLFAQRLYARNEDPLHLFLEEADDYIPQKPFRDEAQLLRAWENIVRRGRARGLGMTMITQRSAKINKDVLTQAETLITLRTTSPQDRAAVEAWVKYHAAKEEILESLSSLEDGEAWVWSPHYLGDTFRMRFPLSRTFDSGATPKNARAGERRAPATMADIDLTELRTKMEATIARAKAEDPRELRQEVAKLKAELSRQGSNPENAKRSYDQGYGDGYREGYKTGSREQGRRVRAIIHETIEPIRSIVEHLGEEEIEPTMVRKPAQNVGWPKGKPRSIAHVTTALVTSENSEKSPSLRKILTALAQHPEGMDINRLAALSGYTVNGHFNNMVGTLRADGRITPARVSPIQITEAGLKALGSFEPLPTGEALREYWLNRVGMSKGRILEVLYNVYPHPIGIEELAERAGYTVNGHFNNMIGSLRTMGLITPPRQPIKAVDYLFED